MQTAKFQGPRISLPEGLECVENTVFEGDIAFSPHKLGMVQGRISGRRGPHDAAVQIILAGWSGGAQRLPAPAGQFSGPAGQPVDRDGEAAVPCGIQAFRSPLLTAQFCDRINANQETAGTYGMLFAA